MLRALQYRLLHQPCLQLPVHWKLRDRGPPRPYKTLWTETKGLQDLRGKRETKETRATQAPPAHLATLEPQEIHLQAELEARDRRGVPGQQGVLGQQAHQGQQTLACWRLQTASTV